MKAAYQPKYGSPDILEIRDIPRPDIAPDEMLVQVHASAVTTADWRLRASAFPLYAWLPGRIMFGLTRPKAPVGGMAFSGRVVAKGENATGFKGGDAVFGLVKSGAHAEYLVVKPGDAIALKPEAISHAEAAATPFGALAALDFLRDFAKVQPGQSVLIHGASGGVGVFAVQLARHFGAQVTAVASAKNHEMLRRLGADHVIDYHEQDFTRLSKRYDLVFDTVGKTRFRDVRRVLTPSGIYLPIEFGLREIAQSILTARSSGQRVVIGVSGDDIADLRLIAGLLENGDIHSVLGATFPLDDIAAAHAQVETRHTAGTVVITPRAEADAIAAVA